MLAGFRAVSVNWLKQQRPLPRVPLSDFERFSEEIKVCDVIAEAFGSVDYPILPLVKRIENGRLILYRRNPKLCTPAGLDYLPYFDIVKYPFLDMHRYAELYLSRREDAGTLTTAEADIYMPHPLQDIARAPARR